MTATSSSFFSRDSTLLNVGAPQTFNRRKGSRLIVRANAVSLKCTLQQWWVPFVCVCFKYMILLCERMPHCLLFQLYKAHVNYSIYFTEYPLFVNMQDYYSVLGISILCVPLQCQVVLESKCYPYLSKFLFIGILVIIILLIHFLLLYKILMLERISPSIFNHFISLTLQKQ